jgi:8-oxo-dGTP pyrophosphatase MutT (NUDIX family)
MHRNNLLKLLEEYIATPEEKIFKEDMLKFIKANDNCFERELEIGHMTGSALLLNKAGDKVLLMHHMKLDRWFQLGGHADGDTDILAVAIKEAQEESGINHIEAVKEEIFDVDVHLIPENSKDKEHFHYDVRFLLQVKSDEEVKDNRESKELRWVSLDIDKLPTDEPSIIRMIGKLKDLT